MSERRCAQCGATRELSEFPSDPGAAAGRGYTCNACKAERTRSYKATIAPEDKAEAQRAYRAGVRQNKCAVCGDAISGLGICDRCAGHIAGLGGLDGLKQAVRAVRYIDGK